MKEAANSLLKVLEEPPDYATILLLANNPGELLTTIRSRCVGFTLGALPVAELEAYVATHRKELKPAQRTLVAKLAEGAVGRARGFNLEAYIASRSDALTLLKTAIEGEDHSVLFRVTEAYRAGAEGKDKTELLVAGLYSLLEDLLLLRSRTPELVRNVDIEKELVSLGARAGFEWLESAAYALGEVQTGMRRNLLRSLSLDAFVAAMESRA
jgi:DNA polymerase-3 subunit delta'